MSTWIQTFTGKKFDILNPEIESIDIVDIAHSLSNICRFNGHSQWNYSVAQHSVLVSTDMDKKYALDGLMHDAAEAYICDLPKPIKQTINGYSEIENNIQDLIYEKFNILKSSQTKVIDERILVDEMEQLMPNHPEDWGHKVAKLGIKIERWNFAASLENFLNRFNELIK